MIQAHDHVESWLRDHEDQIGVKPSKWERSDIHAEKFNAWYETNMHLIDICCWNNASCLDIIALNKETKKEDFMLAGECDGQIGLTGRLLKFLDWLKTTRLKAEQGS